jgi:predicted outer membrane repeat protein
MRFAVLAFVVCGITLPSYAATIDVAAGEVALSPGNGKCSLREAILNAEAGGDVSGGDCAAGTAGVDVISLAAGSTYVLPDQDPNHADNEVNGLPEIHYEIRIDGNAATIERDPALFSGTPCGGVGVRFRIFYVSGLGSLTLTNVTLQNGCANVSGVQGAGGAILNRGTLNLDTVTLANNEALRSGGAIHNDGTMTLTRSTVSNNAVTAPEAGGGGITNRGAMQVVQSTVSGNHSAGAGGGIDTGLTDLGAGAATFANSTVSGNVSEGDGGGIFNRSPSTMVVNSTVLANRGTNSAAAGLGSGIFVASGALTPTNSLVAQQANGANCFGVSSGGNDLADDASCSGAAFTSTPMVGPLANNGGPTLTHALLLGSPAIDAGNSTICSAPLVNAVDQRGVSRPQGANCDIGAFELTKYDVHYDGNGNDGGSAPTGGTYAAGETVTVSGNTGGLIRTGYTFIGWNTAANGSGTS